MNFNAPTKSENGLGDLKKKKIKKKKEKENRSIAIQLLILLMKPWFSLLFLEYNWWSFSICELT